VTSPRVILLHLAAVMGPPLTLVPGPRDLLLSLRPEGFEPWEETLHIVEVSQPLGSPVDLPGQKPHTMRLTAGGAQLQHRNFESFQSACQASARFMGFDSPPSHSREQLRNAGDHNGGREHEDQRFLYVDR